MDIVYKRKFNRADYQRIDKVYADFSTFFDEHMNGKRQGEGIISRFLGFAGDITLFWFEGDPEVYAFCQPYPEGLYFYIRKKVDA